MERVKAGTERMHKTYPFGLTVQGLLERLKKMSKDPLGHMSSQLTSVLIGEPEMNSVQDNLQSLMNP